MTDKQNILRPWLKLTIHQFGRLPVLEEARTMDFVTSHNRITTAMSIFKTLKMAAEREVISELNCRRFHLSVDMWQKNTF